MCTYTLSLPGGKSLVKIPLESVYFQMKQSQTEN